MATDDLAGLGDVVEARTRDVVLPPGYADGVLRRARAHRRRAATVRVALSAVVVAAVAVGVTAVLRPAPGPTPGTTPTVTGTPSPSLGPVPPVDHVEPPVEPGGRSTLHLGTAAVELPERWIVTRLLRAGRGAVLDVMDVDERFAAVVDADGEIARIEGLTPPVAVDAAGTVVAGVVSGRGRGRGLALYDLAERRITARAEAIEGAWPRAVLADGTVIAMVGPDDESMTPWAWAPGTPPARVPATGPLADAASAALTPSERARGTTLEVRQGAEWIRIPVPVPVRVAQRVGEDTVLTWDEEAPERVYFACRISTATCAPYVFGGRGAYVVAE